MSGKFFVDSNIIIYALGSEVRKKSIAVGLLNGATLSTQVLNEVAQVMRRKLHFPIADVRTVLERLGTHCFIHTVTVANVFDALTLAERYGMSHYDSLILASALASGCGVIYSEDLQHQQVIDQRLMIRNPFLLAAEG